MADPVWLDGPPKKIMLATDLSARSDRAMDRAAALARQWQAQLVVLHVLDVLGLDSPAHSLPLPTWRQPVSRVNVARMSIVADLGEAADDATILVKEGDAAETIMRTAEAEGCGLTVIGTASNEFLALLGLGGTAEGLIRASHVPLLVVKKRATHRYRDVVIATDFSESSRHALNAALNFFPDERLAVFHAYDSPMAGLTADPRSYRQQHLEAAEKECTRFLRDTRLLDESRRRPAVRIEAGFPGPLLHDYVAEKGVDLVVLGTHGRSAMFNVLIGSVAQQILNDVPCDALVIRDPHAR